ncbi:RNF17 protein, partial [Acromyrmex charruanus]
IIYRMDAEYTIYVRNLPIELNEDGIRDIFSQYGKIKEMFHPRRATWTYVTFGTYREAELAMRELHEKKPLCLKVALAKENSRREEEHFEKMKVIDTADSPPPIHNDIKYQNMDHGQPTHALHKHVMPHITVPCSFPNYESLSSLSSCSQTYSTYELEDPYMSTNKLWTRALVEEINDISSLQINQDANQIKKTISNVDKQTKSSDVKLRRPNTFNAMQIENSNNASENINEHENNIEATYKSINNIKDKHVSSQRVSNINEFQTKMADQPVVNATNTKEFSQQHRLRGHNNTNESIDQSKKNNGCSPTSFSRNQYSRNYQNDSKKTSLKERHDNNSNIRDKTYNNDRNDSQRNSFQSDKDSDYNGRENTNRHGSEKISVRMLTLNSEKTIIVEIEEEQSTAKNLSSSTESASNGTKKKLLPQKKVPPNKSTNPSTIQIPSVLDALADLTQNSSELQIDGFIQFFESTQKNVYSVTLLPQVFSTEVTMIFEDIQEECSKIQIPADYKPKAEELVCGYWQECWYRGYISTYPDSIFAIDEARILQVNEIVPCPKKYLNICVFGVICEINHSTMNHNYEFTSIINENSNKQKSLEIQIYVNSEVIQAVLKTWKPTNLSNFDLKNGSKICLTSYRNHYCMFARSLEEVDVEYYNNVMQSVAQYAQTAPYLTAPPSDKEVVIAPFEGDGNSYRAMVLKTQNNKAQIVYIDFGNLAEIDIKDLKVMPYHSQQQSCAVKVILKDIPRDVPMNQEVDMYLRHISGTEVPLICTFEGLSKDGVRLTIADTGECVNDKINQLLIPGWKQANNNDNTCYMFNDIKLASLGHVGDTVNALVVYVAKEDVTSYMIGPEDFELMTHIFEVMPAMLKEYCEKMEYYIPRTQELCLALYDGIWYRAVCLNPKESHRTAQIFFIDYGNIELVEHKDIRLMPKDFILPRAFANMCNLVNLAPVDRNGQYSEAVQKKLKELITENSFIKIKIVEYSEDGYYKIEVPEVRAMLIKHGLV